MNGYDAQDMASQGADGFRNGYQAGYADAVNAIEAAQPAAAQEAVGWQRKYLGATRGGRPVDWHNITREEFEQTKSGKWADKYDVRELFAAPVTAAPVGGRDVRSAIAGLEGSVAVGSDGEWVSVRRAARDAAVMALRNVSLDCAHIYAAYSEAKASTPAAPGIDLTVPDYIKQAHDKCKLWPESNWPGFEPDAGFIALLEIRNWVETLIDASPKGERVSNPDELAFAARGFLGASFAPSAEESTREMRDTYSYWHRRLLRAAGGAMDYEQATDTAADSPKVGSDARALLDALVSLVAVARRYLPDYDEHPEVQKADDAIDAAMQAQAGDAEVQP